MVDPEVQFHLPSPALVEMMEAIEHAREEINSLFYADLFNAMISDASAAALPETLPRGDGG